MASRSKLARVAEDISEEENYDDDKYDDEEVSSHSSQPRKVADAPAAVVSPKPQKAIASEALGADALPTSTCPALF